MKIQVLYLDIFFFVFAVLKNNFDALNIIFKVKMAKPQIAFPCEFYFKI